MTRRRLLQASAGGLAITAAGSFLTTGGARAANELQLQAGWLWCGSCQLLFYGGLNYVNAGACPAKVGRGIPFPQHLAGTSWHYAVPFNQPTTGTSPEFLRWSLCGDAAAKARLPAAAAVGGVATLEDEL